MRWGLNIKDLECDERDFKFVSGFNRTPTQKTQYRIDKKSGIICIAVKMYAIPPNNTA